MLEKFLEEIGLSDKEAKAYLALIEVDDDSVLGVAERTGINRTTVYPVLESLAKKGLVSEVQSGKKTHYRAEPPERLSSFVERRRLALDEQAARMSDIVPQLKSLVREGGKKPIIKYYEGKEGVLSAMEGYFDSLQQGDDTVYMAYPASLLKGIFTPEEIAKASKGRKERKVKVVSVYTSETGPRPTSPDDMSDRVMVDAKEYPILCDISVVGNSVRLHTLGDKLSAIYIESPDVAQTIRSLIKLAHRMGQAKV